jgi:endonuclease/exonuclease/phosphatase family metal-dependent hydrolase
MHDTTPALVKQVFVGILTVLGLVVMLVLVVRPQDSSLPNATAKFEAQTVPQATSLPTPDAEVPTGLPDPTQGAPSLDLPTILPEHFPGKKGRDKTPTKTAEVLVATANLYTKLAWPQARADLERLAAAVDLIGLNEVTPRRAGEISAWTTANPDWEFVRPMDSRSSWSGSNAVLVRTSTFEVLERGVVYGSRASMPAYKVDSRWITWVQLRERTTGRGLVWLQTHMDAAVESNGAPRRGAGERVRNNAQYMRTLLRMAQSFERNHEVLVGGDWNVDARADRRVQHPQMPYTMLEQRAAPDTGGLRSTYSLLGLDVPPTSRYAGGRWIDYVAVWTRPDGEGATVTGHQVVTGVNSDHNPLVAGVQLTAP